MESEFTDPSSLPGRDASKAVFWKQHVDAWRDSKLTQREYARQHDLVVHALFTGRTNSVPIQGSGKNNLSLCVFPQHSSPFD